jgi:hypothetical protein
LKHEGTEEAEDELKFFIVYAKIVLCENFSRRTHCREALEEGDGGK